MMEGVGLGKQSGGPTGDQGMGTYSSQADINHDLSHTSSAVFYHMLSRTKGKREITPQLLRSVAFSSGLPLPCPAQSS